MTGISGGLAAGSQNSVAPFGLTSARGFLGAGGRGVVPVGVGDKDMADRFILDGRKQRLDMPRIVGARISGQRRRLADPERHR